MKWLLAAIGKAKANSPESQMVAEYSKRLSGKFTLKEIESKVPNKPKEAEALLVACAGYDKVIALDERGKDISSRELALQLSKWQQQGTSSVAFIIGGADGLDESVRKRADLTLAFGRATWPHMLVRAMIAEQIYRAQTINDGHPYHRD